MIKAFKRFMLNRGASDVLTMIMSPAFLAYGIGLLLGYRSSLLVILGLPPYAYATMFIIAGILKACGLIFQWGRFSHTIGVTVCSFWALVILVFAHWLVGWVGALPWIALAAITFCAAVWPKQPIAAVVITPQTTNGGMDNTDPRMRAIDYLMKREERKIENADTIKR